VLDLVSQVRDVVLMNVYLDLGDPGGLGFWNEGYMSKEREMGSLQAIWERGGWDPITARRVPSNKGRRMRSKREWEKGKQKARGLIYNALYIFMYIMNACNV
jgi:hypothetical protein